MHSEQSIVWEPTVKSILLLFVAYCKNTSFHLILVQNKLLTVLFTDFVLHALARLISFSLALNLSHLFHIGFYLEPYLTGKRPIKTRRNFGKSKLYTQYTAKFKWFVSTVQQNNVTKKKIRREKLNQATKLPFYCLSLLNSEHEIFCKWNFRMKWSLMFGGTEVCIFLSDLN